jgi:hypothetical protein
VIPLYITFLAHADSRLAQTSALNSQSNHTSLAKPLPEHGVHRKRQFAMLRRQLVTRFAPNKAWLPVEKFA